GKEKELTIVDSKERIVTVKKPLKRIVSSKRSAIVMLKVLKVSTDRIVGVSSIMQRPGYENDILFPEFQDKPTVGNLWTPDVEAILNLNPDVVMLMAKHMSGAQTLDNAQNVLESAGIPVIRVYGGAWGKGIPEEVKKLGYVFGKQDEADEFVYFYNKHMDSIKEKVESIPAEDKPKVYFESSKSYSTVAGGNYQYVKAAGGKNIFFEMGSVDPEAVIDRNPDIIVKVAPLSASGYRFDSDDTTEIEKVREEIMNRPELQKVKAVKERRVYVISCRIVSYGSAAGCRGFFHRLYLAKWFHPGLFEDLDPKAIHQEYLTRFQGLDYDLDTKGVFVYPEPS
ncbi:MAG: ABC transporter substrate-binding protein, partial [Methanophagales archaeon]|nr:ABC transporter substrate-binding protein [Methanophagales archaeon]